MPIILIIGAVVIAIGFGALLFFTPNTASETVIPADSNNEINVKVEDIENMHDTKPTDTPKPIPSASANGTFKSTSKYLTPDRAEHLVDVSLTVEGGVVTDSTVLFNNKVLGQYSNDNQARFADAYKAEVIGKSLAEISLSRVGGASLTSRAFNEAVVNITAEATAKSAL